MKSYLKNNYNYIFYLTCLSATINYLFFYYLFICQFSNLIYIKQNIKGVLEKAFWTF